MMHQLSQRAVLLLVAVIALTTTALTRTLAFSPSPLRTRSLSYATNTDCSNLGGRRCNSQRGNKRRGFSLAMSSAVPPVTPSLKPISQSNLAVALDRPILILDNIGPTSSPFSSPSSIWPSFLAIILSDVCKTALVAFFLAASFSLAARLLSKAPSTSAAPPAKGETSTSTNPLSRLLSTLKLQIATLLEPILSSTKSSSSTTAPNTTPMPFEGDGGWGKCTLRSKRKIGASSFTLYEFSLPKSEYTLKLALGQQLDFCCLGAGDEICTGSFYPYEMGEEEDGGGGRRGTSGVRRGGSKGVVRIVVPNRDAEGNAALVGLGSSKFIEVLRNELRPGDEVAIKPGKSTLTYRGEHVPVTDMVYLASGLGIVPIVDQIKAITPKGSSSVKATSVVWINENRSDFDLAMDELEREYMKYSTKLAVSCILDDVEKNPMEANTEVEEAVPYFNAGTMAVISGPKRFTEKAKAYLMRKGYPENCICILP
mmetsp:Transcript_1523/g.3142  ORF Transcript_1523/g.3142 Transcript_1523/m.3142 type:complete len:483 (-) Transcript_1523:390-1838(-)|eukprot:CAMPEP_0171349290 /NCGR_PEP_ID=MMETSP0878-20121228/33327_1 /TAXON_ID=67004 /ORGANISM="Thalassiosira weissflogii, Strain CCMP1336" /LENGTH=482 /DNA_ID=CAMNT_0011853907 /DNA_START=291 /DNA_END=1739 /DNA_ORIENTATION=-